MRVVLRPFVLLLLLAGPALAEEPFSEKEDRLAAQVLEAFARGGAQAVDKIATPKTLYAIDPFRVAERLLLNHAEALVTKPPRESTAMAAAAAWASAATKRPAGKELPALVARWKTLDRTALEDLVRLREAYIARARALGREDWTEVARIAALVRPLIERSLWSTTAVDIEAHAITAVSRTGDVGQAALRDQALAERCVKMGWTRCGAALLGRAGGAYADIGNQKAAAASLQRARELYEQLDRPANAADQLILEARLDRRGALLDRAHEKVRRAIAILENLDEKEKLARALSELGNLERVRGRPDASIAAHERVLAIAVALDDHAGQITAHANIGVVHGDRMAYAQATAHYEQALRIADQTKAVPPYQLDVVRLNLAGMLGLQGHHEEAIALCRQAVTHQERTKSQIHLAYALGRLGVALGKVGCFAEAAGVLERALVLRRGRRQYAAEMRLLFQLAKLRTATGQLTQAIRHGEEALAIAERLKSTAFIGRALSDLGSIHAAGGRNQEAFAYLQRAYEHAKASGDVGLMQLVVANLGAVLSNLGKRDEAVPMLEDAVKTARHFGHVTMLIHSLENLGITRMEQGRTAEAEAHFEEALAEAERIDGRPMMAEILRYRCVNQFRRGNYTAAAAHGRRAVELRLEFARGMGAGEALGVRTATRLVVDFALDASIVHIDKDGLTDDRLARIFWLTEAGRNLGLLEGLVNRTALLGSDVPRALEDAEAGARDDVRLLQQQLVRAAHQKPADTSRLQAMRAELDEAYRMLEAAVASTDRGTRRNAALVAARPATLDAVKAAVPEGTAFLTYQLMPGGQAVLLCVARDGARLVRLGNTKPVVERALAWQRVLRTPGTKDRAAASALYDAVLKPLEQVEDLDRFKRLIVAPDGVLAWLPLDALVRGGPEGKRLIETHDVVNVPSASVFAALEGRRTGRGLLALGDPVYERTQGKAPLPALAVRGLSDLGPIPATGDEVRAIAALFAKEPQTLLLRERASRQALESALAGISGRLRSVHIACHGLLDTQRPMLTGLVLSGGSILSVGDIYRLSVPADLVVLSACETGLGKLTEAEGVLGLTRGFFFAGAPRVVVSNWKVSDRSTKDLMVAFYAGMQKEGLAPAAALRKAKRAQIAAGRKHPYHWAGFVLWGRSD